MTWLTWFLIFLPLWIAIGFSTWLYFERDHGPVIWSSLLIFLPMAIICGPLPWFVIGFVMLTQAEFWSKPVFKKKDTIRPGRDFGL